MVQGIERVVVVKVERERIPEGPDPSAAFARRFQPRDRSADALAGRDWHRSTSNLMQGQPPQDIARLFAAQTDPLQLAFLVASVMNLEVEKEQALLEDSIAAGSAAHGARLAVARSGRGRTAQQNHRGSSTEMSREQREYVLRQQKKAIEQELGEGGPSRPMSRTCASAWTRPICPRTSARKPSASWIGWRRSIRPRRSTT